MLCKRLFHVILLFLRPNSFEIKGKHSPILNLKEFGAGNTGDATPKIVEALTRYKEEISKLVFSRNTYHFRQIFTPERYSAMVIDDNELRRTSV